MAQIPGNEIFPEQKRNYGSDNIVYVEISIDTGNDDYGNGAGYSAWFKPGNARAVFWVSTLGNIAAKCVLMDQKRHQNGEKCILLDKFLKLPT